MLHNQLQFLFCCSYGNLCLCYNNLLILHGKPQPNQFSTNRFFSPFASRIFAYAHFSKLHNNVCSSRTFLISNDNMSYGHKACCIKQLPFFSTFGVGLLPNHVVASPPLKINKSILPFLSFPTSFL